MFSLRRKQISPQQSVAERAQRFVQQSVAERAKRFVPSSRVPKASAASATRTKSIVLGLVASLTLLLCIGCTSDEAPKASLFEHDHFVAAHWPSGLEDLSQKLRRRLASARAGETEFHDPPEDHHDDEHDHEHDHDDHPEVSLFEQVSDLVSWVGEIAADTNLSEADWIPLYEKSESLLAGLKSSRGELGEDHFRELESLCDLIDASIPKIPDTLPSYYATDP